MSLVEVTGNLFTTPGLDALGHGVNCQGRMGAGIAVDFKRRWPAMFHRYRVACSSGMRPGDCLVCPETKPIWIYCLATQPSPGPCASLPAIQVAVQRMLAHARAAGVTRIGIPRIGAGLGGASWRDVRAVLEELAARAPVELVVVTRPEDIRPPPSPPSYREAA
jgi:O-acetyl-ADP-ribose deacetylase (regulator of RNase III)